MGPGNHVQAAELQVLALSGDRSTERQGDSVKGGAFADTQVAHAIGAQLREPRQSSNEGPSVRPARFVSSAV